jgi:4-hydroxybenzoate polyprenyltransferase/phosphoglycolate phosphatase-like HAD superfamily hydrolase
MQRMTTVEPVLVDPVLVVDMDGTLTRTDTLHEAVLAYVAADPFRLFRLVRWLREGKAGFKRRLAGERLLDAGALPLNESVVALLEKARAEGRRTALVSAADQRQAEALAAQLGLFDEVHGTGTAAAGDGVNLGGREKAAFLCLRYGERGYDYVGDSRADLPAWAAARRAITVNAPRALRAAAERLNPSIEHIAGPEASRRRIGTYLGALRPHQWSKNLLIFLPILAAHDLGATGVAIAAFIAFSLTASSVYILNDMLDLEADRAHPRKRTRAFASGTIPLSHGFVLAPGLLAAAVIIALVFTPIAFLGVLALYYALTLAYSLWLKRKLIIDVWTLAGLYTIRILAGAAAAGVPLSFWMLAFSMFLFLSLAAVKRQAELTERLRHGKQKWAAGRAYVADDLPVVRGMALAAGYGAVLVFALYIDSPDVAELYARPQILWAACPILLYWVSRMVMVTHRGWMTDDPIVFAVRDRVSLGAVALAGAVVLAAGPL